MTFKLPFCSRVGEMEVPKNGDTLCSWQCSQVSYVMACLLDIAH